MSSFLLHVSSIHYTGRSVLFVHYLCLYLRQLIFLQRCAIVTRRMFRRSVLEPILVVFVRSSEFVFL